MFGKRPAFWNTGYKKFKKTYTEPVMHNNRIYTKEIAVSLDRKKTRRNGHTFLLASRREAHQWLYTNILQANSNYVIPDFDGLIYQDTHQYLQEQGYQVHVLNISKPETGINYNPLTCIKPYAGKYMDAINNMVDTMLYRHKATDPFKYTTAETLLRAILHYVKTLPVEQQTVETMKTLMPKTQPDPRQPWDGGIMKTSSDHIVLYCLDVLHQIPSIMLLEAAVDICTVLHYIDMITTNGPSFDINQLSSGKHAVYLIYGNQTWHREIISLFYTQLLDTLYTAAENAKTCHLNENWLLYVDQWHHNMAQRLATSSKYNINFVVQSRMMAELKYTYQMEWEIIVGNCDVILYEPGVGCDETEYMTKILRRVVKHGQCNNITRIELSKITPEQCVVCMRGEYPFLCTKYKWQQHPKAIELPQKEV